ncbi:MAG: hypothetical protein WDO73_07500 [Ignavibacteriota bacterium]
MITHLRAQQGRTLFLTTHYMDEGRPSLRSPGNRRQGKGGGDGYAGVR